MLGINSRSYHKVLQGNIRSLELIRHDIFYSVCSIFTLCLHLYLFCLKHNDIMFVLFYSDLKMKVITRGVLMIIFLDIDHYRTSPSYIPYNRYPWLSCGERGIIPIWSNYKNIMTIAFIRRRVQADENNDGTNGNEN